MPDEPGRLECYLNMKNWVALIVIGIVGAPFVYFFIGHSSPIHIFANYLILVILLGTVIWRTYRLFKRGPVIIIDEVGIEDVRTGIGIIPWEEIRTVLVFRIHSNDFICIDSTDKKSLLSIIPWYRKVWARINSFFLRIPPIYINLIGLDKSLDEIIDFISDHGYLLEVDYEDKSLPEGLVMINPIHMHQNND